MLYGTAIFWKVDVRSSKNLTRFWVFFTRFGANAILYGTLVLWKVDVKSSKNLARFWVLLTGFGAKARHTRPLNFISRPLYYLPH